MKKQIVDLSSKLISFDSIDKNKKELKKIINFTKSQLKGFEYKEFARNDRPSIIFYNTKTFPSKFKLILNAHLDIVPCDKSQLIAQIKADKLIGRGTYDMKAAGAVQLLVFKALAKKVDYPIGLQFVTDEEIGGFDGVYLQLEEELRSEFVISGEPTNLGINTKAKGPIWMDITTKGSSTHAAYLWRGDNAVVKLVGIINQILEKWPVPKNEVWKTTANLSWIKTDNNAANKVPDSATARLDIRCIPEDVGRVIPTIKKLVGTNGSINIIEDDPAQFTKKANPYVKKLKKSADTILGKSTDFIVKHGASDVRHFNKFNIPGVTFGPTGFGHHSDDEWVSISSLVDFYNILMDFGIKLNT